MRRENNEFYDRIYAIGIATREAQGRELSDTCNVTRAISPKDNFPRGRNSSFYSATAEASVRKLRYLKQYNAVTSALNTST